MNEIQNLPKKPYTQGILTLFPVKSSLFPLVAENSQLVDAI
ncbi:MAG: hypothetical protein ACKPIX_05585 [Dolichospermum sp.]